MLALCSRTYVCFWSGSQFLCFSAPVFDLVSSQYHNIHGGQWLWYAINSKHTERVFGAKWFGRLHVDIVCDCNCITIFARFSLSFRRCNCIAVSEQASRSRRLHSSVGCTTTFLQRVDRKYLAERSHARARGRVEASEASPAHNNTTPLPHIPLRCEVS